MFGVWGHTHREPACVEGCGADAEPVVDTACVLGLWGRCRACVCLRCWGGRPGYTCRPRVSSLDCVQNGVPRQLLQTAIDKRTMQHCCPSHEVVASAAQSMHVAPTLVALACHTCAHCLSHSWPWLITTVAIWRPAPNSDTSPFLSRKAVSGVAKNPWSTVALLP